MSPSAGPRNSAGVSRELARISSAAAHSVRFTSAMSSVRICDTSSLGALALRSGNQQLVCLVRTLVEEPVRPFDDAASRRQRHVLEARGAARVSLRKEDRKLRAKKV